MASVAAQNGYIKLCSEGVKESSMKKYIKISSPESGDLYIDPDSGEVFQPHDDMYIITSARAIKARIKSGERLRRIQSERSAPAYGDFCWVCYPESGVLFNEVSSADAARLLYLASYMGYDGYLQKDGRYINPSDLPGLLRIQPRESRNFRASASCYLGSDEENRLFLQGGVFHRGALTPTSVAAAGANGMKYTRLYHSSIRYLYQSKRKEDRFLLRLLPVILVSLDAQQNKLCKNNQSLSWRQLCITAGRDATHASRDKTALLQAYIKTAHGAEAVLAYNKNGIYLNPRVAFAGNRAEAESLNNLFVNASIAPPLGQARPPNSFRGILPLVLSEPNKTKPRKDD